MRLFQQQVLKVGCKCTVFHNLNASFDMYYMFAF